MPDSPNLLFTNAGMNQFVPIFLGQTKCPYTPGRAADTQKCIRAGGKHNDLDDVGLDTYHHTFFEMLGNWSFGDYFKKEAIDWAWELVVEKWKFPPTRLYATVYSPDKSKNDPSEFDQEAWNFWAEKFRAAGLDPKIHIVNGNKKDNFWMMGETGPCGPCSELHVDLTPNGDTKGSLVNKGDARCIEIWNLVFIQFNANPDGTFSPLPAKHVDTGMGFERVTSIIQGTKGFTDFANAKISNYETDIFRPIFNKLEELSGKTYKSTLPDGQKDTSGSSVGAYGTPECAHAPSVGVPVAPVDAHASSVSAHAAPVGADKPSVDANKSSVGSNAPRVNTHASSVDANQLAVDIAFRVIADHIRTLSFAIADGIQPGNNDRNYVLRRILRRAVRYGRTLGFHEPFFCKLVDVLADTMGEVFPEIRAKKKHVQEVIRVEEEAFNKTLDTGIELFNALAEFQIKSQARIKKLLEAKTDPDKNFAAYDALLIFGGSSNIEGRDFVLRSMSSEENTLRIFRNKFVHEIVSTPAEVVAQARPEIEILATQIKNRGPIVSGVAAFTLYDTYGFPLDLTELMARERGLTVDKDGFEKLMEEQRARARAAQKKEVISLSQIETTTPTKFVGYERQNCEAKVLEVVSIKEKVGAIIDVTPFYAEMGGQVGDAGWLIRSEDSIGVDVINTTKSGATWIHWLKDEDNLIKAGAKVMAMLDWNRRPAIQRHHTVTHLLHWALHEVVSKDATQKGSFVGPDKLTFDFNSVPLTPSQVADIEKLVNEKILENANVSWTEVPHADVKNRKDVMQFFGDKYGDTVRVVQIGGHAGKLDGYSMELCGGTHTRATGEIGLFRIVSEAAVAAGVRRIEAVAGLEAYKRANEELHLIRSVAGKVGSPVHELEKKIESLLEQQKELQKQIKTAQQREASNVASNLLEQIHALNGIPTIIHNVGAVDGDFLQAVADSLKGRFKGMIVLGGAANGAVSLVATVSPDFTAKIQAGKIIQTIAPIVGGKGGGKPDNARGGGKDAAKLDEALAKAKSLLG